MAPYAASKEKIGIQINNTVQTSERKINNFHLKELPPQNIVPYLMFIIWNLIAIF